MNVVQATLNIEDAMFANCAIPRSLLLLLTCFALQLLNKSFESCFWHCRHAVCVLLQSRLFIERSSLWVGIV